MIRRTLASYAQSALYLSALSLHAQPQAQQAVISSSKLSPVVVDVTPGAVCTLRGQDDSGAVRSLILYANDQGQVQFHAQAHAETSNPAKLDLQCAAGGTFTEHSIQLKVDSTLAAAQPAALRAPSGPAAHVRPALTGNPQAISPEELASLGYPVRPDAVQEPEAYATWLRMVTTPTTMVQSHTVAQAGRTHAPAPPSPIKPGNLPQSTSFLNWSGFAVYQDGRVLDPVPLKPYVVVSGEWVVPSVTGEPNVQDDSAFWVGMDGFNTGDVLQDGTEQQAFSINIIGVQFSITSYYGWAEFFPLYEQRITNFTVRPGDHMLGVVWMADSAGTPSVSGTTGICYLQNLTTGIGTFSYIAPPPGTVFTGSTAEWIMERPTVNGAFTDLSDYSAASMFNAYATRTDGTTVNASGNTNSVNIAMVDNGWKPMSEVAPISDTWMVFQWLAFK